MSGFVTEEQARTMWCPMSRAQHNGRVMNRAESVGKGPANSACVGSGCMMWRAAGGDMSAAKAGYCGLAGRPGS